MDGQLTLGENMADHGGLKVSLDAFLESVKEAPPCSCDFESLVRVFFISYAQVRGAHAQEKLTEKLMLLSSGAPSRILARRR